MNGSEKPAYLAGTTLLPITRTTAEKGLCRTATLNLEKPNVAMEQEKSKSAPDNAVDWDICGHVTASWHCFRESCAGGTVTKSPACRQVERVPTPAEMLPQSWASQTIILDDITATLPAGLVNWISEKRMLLCMQIQPHGRPVGPGDDQSTGTQYRATLQPIGGRQYLWTLQNDTSMTELLGTYLEESKQSEPCRIIWNKPLMLHNVLPEHDHYIGSSKEDEDDGLAALSIRLVAFNADSCEAIRRDAVRHNQELQHLKEHPSAAHKIVNVAQRVNLAPTSKGKGIKLASGRVKWKTFHWTLHEEGLEHHQLEMQLSPTAELMKLSNDVLDRGELYGNYFVQCRVNGIKSGASEESRKQEGEFTGIMTCHTPDVVPVAVNVPSSSSKRKLTTTTSVSGLVWTNDESTGRIKTTLVHLIRGAKSADANEAIHLPSFHIDTSMFEGPEMNAGGKYTFCEAGELTAKPSSTARTAVKFTATDYLQVDALIQNGPEELPAVACIPLYPAFITPGKTVKVQSFFFVADGIHSGHGLPISYQSDSKEKQTWSGFTLEKFSSITAPGHLRNVLAAYCATVAERRYDLTRMDALPVVRKEKAGDIPLVYSADFSITFIPCATKKFGTNIRHWPMLAPPQNHACSICSQILQSYYSAMEIQSQGATEPTGRATFHRFMHSLAKLHKTAGSFTSLDTIKLVSTQGTVKKLALRIVDRLIFLLSATFEGGSKELGVQSVILPQWCTFRGLHVQINDDTIDNARDLALEVVEHYAQPTIFARVKASNLRVACSRKELLTLLIAFAVECSTPQSAHTEETFLQRTSKLLERITKSIPITWKQITDYMSYLLRFWATIFVSTTAEIMMHHHNTDDLEPIQEQLISSRKHGTIFRVVLLEIFSALGYTAFSKSTLMRINCLTAMQSSDATDTMHSSYSHSTFRIRPLSAPAGTTKASNGDHKIFSPLKHSVVKSVANGIRKEDLDTSAGTLPFFPPVAKLKSRVARSKTVRKIYLNHDETKEDRPKHPRRRRSHKKKKSSKQYAARLPTPILSRTNENNSNRPGAKDNRARRVAPFSPIRSPKHAIEAIEKRRLDRKSEREHIARSETYRKLINSYEDVSSQTNREGDQIFKIIDAIDDRSDPQLSPKSSCEQEPRYDTPTSSVRSGNQHEEIADNSISSDYMGIKASDEATDVLRLRMKRLNGLFYCTAKALVCLQQTRRVLRSRKK
eukprot:gb/GECG01005727.1/.p1 GENE.gb/GECG01005727.1/~~gb/GECG01005727.1/.p1  ORF type:complete len:1213 (+),score=130.39 gb/GECG01005727.1/:1-3639(+)